MTRAVLMGIFATLGVLVLFSAVCHEPRCRADWWGEMVRGANRG